MPSTFRKVESDLLRQLRLASKDSAAVKKEGETAGMADMKSLLGDMKVKSREMGGTYAMPGVHYAVVDSDH